LKPQELRCHLWCCSFSQAEAVTPIASESIPIITLLPSVEDFVPTARCTAVCPAPVGELIIIPCPKVTLLPWIHYSIPASRGGKPAVTPAPEGEPRVVEPRLALLPKQTLEHIVPTPPHFQESPTTAPIEVSRIPVVTLFSGGDHPVADPRHNSCLKLASRTAAISRYCVPIITSFSRPEESIPTGAQCKPRFALAELRTAITAVGVPIVTLFVGIEGTVATGRQSFTQEWLGSFISCRRDLPFE